MKVLVVSQRFWPENEKINDICREMVARGLRVDVLTGQPNFPRGRFFKGYKAMGNRLQHKWGIRIFRTFELALEDGTGYQRVGNYFSFAIGAAIRSLFLARNKYDAVLIWQTSPVMQIETGLRVARRLKVPAVTVAVDLWPHAFVDEMELKSPMLKKIFASVSQRNYLESDLLIATSSRMYTYFKTTLKVLESRLKLVNLCPDSAFLTPVTDPVIMERYNGSFNIVWAGQFWKKQDFDTLYETGLLMLSAGLKTIRLVMVGKSKELSELRARCHSAHLEDIFYFEEVTAQKDYAKYYHIADAFLGVRQGDLSDEYAPGLETINYMAAGKPILMMSGGNERKLVKDGKCGFTCDNGDARGLFNMIKRVYTCTRADREKMGQAALDYVAEYLNPEDCVSEIIASLSRDGQDEIIINDSSIFKLEDDTDNF